MFRKTINRLQYAVVLAARLCTGCNRFVRHQPFLRHGARTSAHSHRPESRAVVTCRKSPEAVGTRRVNQGEMVQWAGQYTVAKARSPRSVGVGRLLRVSAHPTGRHAEAGRTRQRVDEGEPTLARLETSPSASPNDYPTDLSRL